MNEWNVIGKIIRAGICLGFSVLFSTASAASKDGQALFESRCAACHQLPDLNSPPPEGWAQRLDMMAPLAKLKGKQKAAVLAYLSEHNQQTIKSGSLEEDRVFFETKCSRCHSLDRILLEPLTDESRKHVVGRMQAKSGTGWLSDEDVERVLAYMSSGSLEAPAPPALATGAGAGEIFAARCRTCHSMERIAVHLGPDHEMKMDWSHIVSRMRGKAPQWITDTEAGQIVDYLKSLGAPVTGG